jgi:negative regulator of genetic competence, sporulation and motility
MPLSKAITGPYVITICQGQLTKWKRIYKSFEFQQHAEQHAQANERQRETDETSSTNSILPFSKAIEVITGILYVRENKEKPTLYSFDEL